MNGAEGAAAGVLLLQARHSNQSAAYFRSTAYAASPEPKLPAALRTRSCGRPGAALKQIVMNLCLNARDAMAQGGTLAVHTLRVEKNDSTWIGWTIEDTGSGMDDATLARIFEQFFTTKERGTGLGLTVVQQFIERFGGHIDVWSRPGQGTRFEVWMRECHAPQDWSV